MTDSKKLVAALKDIRNHAHTQANCILTGDDEIGKPAQLRNYYGRKFREIQKLVDSVLEQPK